MERTWDVGHDSDANSSDNSSDEYENHDTTKVNGNSAENTDSVHINSVVGAAIKAGSSKGLPIRNRRNKPVKPSWRERLEDSWRDPTDEESDLSDSIATSSDDSEFSDWSGFTVDDGTDPAVEKPLGELPLKNEANTYLTEQNSTTDEAFDDDIGNQEGTARQRAEQFKAWAREQFDHEGSLSNVASLPVLLPEQRDALVPSLKKSSESPIIVSGDLTRSRVPHNLR